MVEIIGHIYHIIASDVQRPTKASPVKYKWTNQLIKFTDKTSEQTILDLEY